MCPLPQGVTAVLRLDTCAEMTEATPVYLWTLLYLNDNHHLFYVSCT